MEHKKAVLLQGNHAMQCTIFLPTHTDSSIVIIINDYQSLFASYVYIICMTNKDVKFHRKF